jgi:HAD superfamily hydrolase (TIGR01509 family)
MEMHVHVRGVMVDVDGTLLASNDAHALAWAKAFTEHGYPVPYARVRPLIGMGGDKLLPAVVPGLSDSEGVGKEIAARRKAIFLGTYAPTLRPTPGTRALIQRLRADGVRLVVATSAQADELGVLLERAGVADLLPERTSADDAERSKPAADLFRVALRRLRLPPEDVVMLGDTPYDIEGARKVGVATVALRSGGFSDEHLAGALAIHDDPAAWLAVYSAAAFESNA